jgi:hypothetical protein
MDIRVPNNESRFISVKIKIKIYRIDPLYYKNLSSIIKEFKFQ